MEKELLTNYYEVLNCDKTASAEEIKKSYQRLALSSHPDKSDKTEEKFLLIQKAWSVLRNSETRRQYDATLSCHENAEFLLFDSISLSDMNEDGHFYTYSCRCGGIYLLDSNFPIPEKVVIGCDECSFSIEVTR